MAVVSYPGVYVEEIAGGARPIAAAGTSVAAFIGQAERGLIGEAVKVFNFTEYQARYGGFLSSSFLSHAVFQFFNNGGTQCYVVRVAGANTRTAAIALKDRAATPNVSLTIAAKSPGAWGNGLAVVVTDGTNDPGNEINLYVYREDGGGAFTRLEGFENLGMVPGAANFVDRALAASQYVAATVNQANNNVDSGRSLGAQAPMSLAGLGTRLAINVDGDGYQEVDLQDAVAAGQAADLTTAANLAAAIHYVVRQLTRLRSTTAAAAFSGFTCSVNASGVLELASGTKTASSSVRVAAAASGDAGAALRLGELNGGVETLGGAVTRPRVTPPGSYLLVGDNAAPTGEVASVTGGSDGDPVTQDQPYIDALSALDGVQDVSLVAVPGIGSTAVVGAGMSYCENQRPLSDCFFIGDMSQDDDTIEEARAFRAALTPKNSYGAVYLPWVRMLDPTGRSPEPILVPPSGFVAGLYARTDARRGVWKAPAGVGAALSGAVGLAVDFTDVQQGNLNPVNVNVVRRFDAAGIVVWGARTITSDPEWTYVSVRRVANLLKVSIYNGIQWAVFEPNDEPLWAQLRLNVGAFMNNLFRQGAFQGATPSQAYFVKCDGETTTQTDVDLGIVNVLVGFAPLKPAEFIVVKISQKAGQS